VVREVAEGEGFQHVRVGSVGAAMRPGDFILTHGRHWTSALIRVGQALRFRGRDRQYAYWNHAALVVGANGDIIEALGPSPGVALQNVSRYAPREYTVVRIMASPEDRDEAVGFARALERTRAIFTKEPSHIMPADLARAYGVVPPSS